MIQAEGQVLEIRQAPDAIEVGGFFQAYISCPPAVIPSPGQYVLARTLSDHRSVGRDPSPLAETLFPGALHVDYFAHDLPAGFWAAPPLPAGWTPGTRLQLSGPRGVGFQLPLACRRLAIAVLADHAARLAPLIHQALRAGREVALFGGLISLATLPPAVEVHPLAALMEALDWMDFLALDLPLEGLPVLRSRLGLPPALRLPCPAQALIYAPMPCGGVGDCGVCAVPARRGWLLPCVDGPVIDLSRLIW